MSADKLTAAFEVTAALGRTIRDLGEIPSGKLYAIVMPKMELRAYEGAIKLLKDVGLVAEENHVLKWIGHLQ